MKKYKSNGKYVTISYKVIEDSEIIPYQDRFFLFKGKAYRIYGNEAIDGELFYKCKEMVEIKEKTTD